MLTKIKLYIATFKQFIYDICYPNLAKYVQPIDLDEIEKSLTLSSKINSEIHKKYVIPTVNLSKEKAEQEIAMLIADYKDDVMFDNTTGEFIFTSHNNNETPNIENIKE
jgi:hypothetical protein